MLKNIKNIKSSLDASHSSATIGCVCVWLCVCVCVCLHVCVFACVCVCVVCSLPPDWITANSYRYYYHSSSNYIISYFKKNFVLVEMVDVLNLNELLKGTSLVENT